MAFSKTSLLLGLVFVVVLLVSTKVSARELAEKTQESVQTDSVHETYGDHYHGKNDKYNHGSYGHNKGGYGHDKGHGQYGKPGHGHYGKPGHGHPGHGDAAKNMENQD